MRNIFGDQGNMGRNFWEQGNSVKVNFGEHLNLFLRKKGTTVNFHREQGNMHSPPPPGRPSELSDDKLSADNKLADNKLSDNNLASESVGNRSFFN